MSDVRAAIHSYLVDQVGLSGPITDQTELLHSGILDSLALLSLIHYIETRFRFRFSEEDLSDDHFGSFDALVNLVERRIGPMSA